MFLAEFVCYYAGMTYTEFHIAGQLHAVVKCTIANWKNDKDKLGFIFLDDL